MAFIYILVGIVITYISYLLIIIFLPVLKAEKLPFKKELIDAVIPEFREDVYFEVQGEKVSGWYYTPKDCSPKACIIMSHGFNGTKDCILENYALEFMKQGYSVLTYDYRTYGDSEGYPRQFLSIPMQLEDLSCAVRYIREVKNINNIILWGTSAGATHGLIIASEDHDINGVICQCGAYDHKLDSKKGMDENGIWFYISLLPHGIRDKWRGRLGLSRHKMPAYGMSESRSFIKGDTIFNGAEKLGLRSKNFINEVCASFMLEPHGPDLLNASKNILCPVLILTCEKDEFISKDSYVKLRDILDDKVTVASFPIGHFDIYHDEWFKKSMDKQFEFLGNSGIITT